MKIQVVVFCVVMPCSEDGGSKVIRNVGILPYQCMAPKPRRL